MQTNTKEKYRQARGEIETRIGKKLKKNTEKKHTQLHRDIQIKMKAETEKNGSEKFLAKKQM